jgi:hypothetical protein
MRPSILALDLEGTLISNAVSQIPRPGLRDFLDYARTTFDEVVLFTTVSRHMSLRIALLLAEEGHVPGWFTGSATSNGLGLPRTFDSCLHYLAKLCCLTTTAPTSTGVNTSSGLRPRYSHHRTLLMTVGCRPPSDASGRECRCFLARLTKHQSKPSRQSRRRSHV